MRILFTGGGSGGHIYPLIAVAQKMKELTKDKAELYLDYLGPQDNFNSIFFSNEEINIHKLISAKYRRYFSLANLVDVPKFFLGIFQALLKVLIIMPDIILSKGGSGAFPVVLAGWFYRIPIIIHESDSVPGTSNILSAKLAGRVAVSFKLALDYFDPRKTALVGTPIRKELKDVRLTSEVAKEQLKFSRKAPLILILGGSQGAKKINDFVLTNLEKLIKEAQVLHQTGPANFLEVQKLSRTALIDIPTKIKIENRYQVVSYLDNIDLKTALNAADLVVSRAGSNTLNEIAMFGKPAIVIPLQNSANDHQRINAYEFAKGGGGVVIEEENLFSAIFLNQVEQILTAPGVINKMSEASKKFFRSNAEEIIAKEILKITGLLEKVTTE